MQANLYLKRGGDSSMVSIEALVKSHPLAAGSTIYRMANKITPQAPASCHESTYNLILDLKVRTDTWEIEVGYTRHKDPLGTTHAWVKFRKGCDPL